MNFWQTLPRPIQALAPMEEVTDTVFRRIVARCGRPHVFFTEFVSADGLFSAGRDAVIHRLQYTPVEKPLVAQIWGNKPENYLKAAALLREMGFDGIDINMGCPVPKVVRHGACSALIENRALVRELLAAAREGAGGLPLSIKTRIGFRRRVTEEWIGFLLELEPEALTVHGRIAKHLSAVPADWQEIAKAVALRDAMGAKTLILGNGDVFSAAELQEKAAQSGVDGVMVGRGIFRDLFLFRPAHAMLEMSPGQRLDLMLEHARLFMETWGETRDFAVLKKFFKIYAAGFAGAQALRTQLMAAESLAEVELLVARCRGSLAAVAG